MRDFHDVFYILNEAKIQKNKNVKEVRKNYYILIVY